MKSLKLSLIALLFSFASFAQSAITGATTLCVGSTSPYSDATSGGAWSSASTAILTINSSGVATGITPGVTNIIYTVGSGSVTYTVTVNAAPAGIMGPSVICSGSSVSYTDAVSGGTWSSSFPSVLTMSAITGLATGVSVGTSNLSYTIATGCTASMTVTVSTATPAFTVTGGGAYCSGGTGVSIGLSGSMAGVTYELVLGTTVVGSAIAGTGSALSFGTFTTPGTYVVMATTSGGCTMPMTGTATVVVNTLPTVYNVTGGGNYCAGGSGVLIGLSNSDLGVQYQLLNGGVPVGTAVSGTGSAISFGYQTAAGTYTVIATNVSTGCANSMSGSATVAIATLPNIYSVTGGGSYCSGGTGVTIGVGSSDIGVGYQLYLGGVAVGSSVPGSGAAISFGTFTTAGTYTVVATDLTTGCSSNMSGSATVAVNPLPNVYAVTGGGSYCSGGSGVLVGLSSSTTGVQYQLMNGATPVGAPIPGTGSSISFGLQTVAGVYTVTATDATTGCMSNMSGSATVTITTPSTPTVAITATPGTTVCTGTSVSFTTTETYGGTTPTYQWYVNGVALGTGASYTYSPLNGDVVSVTLISSLSCVTSSTATDNVSMIVDVPTVTATASTASCGGVVTLTAGGASTYSWSPATGLSCTACGTATTSPASSVTYTVTGTDSYGCTGTDTVPVDGNSIYGHIYYSGGSSSDTFTIWLIQYNPSDSTITALDSTTSCWDGGVPYFQFMDPAAGNYMVKAKLNSAVPGTSGYIPTYSYSSSNWSTGATDTHASSADTMNINMVYGTVPSGPGFIAGNVYSGAGRGTSGDVPAPGMLIYLENGSGTVLTYVYTDATGSYSFSNLSYGTYIIYPETYKYYTTPSSIITLSPSSDSVSSVDFKQHTTSGTITPNTTSVPRIVTAANNGYYPNPTSGTLNIALGAHATETADMVITSITGNIVYKASINIDASQTQTQADLSALNEGMYFINFRSADVNFTGKLLIVK